jgi:hypothetical protein
MSTCNPDSNNGILQSAPEAVLPLSQDLLLPESVRVSSLTVNAKEPSRFVVPPEQPPRG